MHRTYWHNRHLSVIHTITCTGQLMQPDSFKVDQFPNLERLQPATASAHQLRVCIATEEIVGPIANGGIASTYFDLARLLVSEGYEVTVLYLKGNICHHETIEHWIAYYAELGVTFTPLPEPDISLDCAAPVWQNRLYMAWRWLRDQPDFDIIHTSEWRGGAYYALLAKNQGLAFNNTLFIVKTSSPHLWNRHYQMRFIENEQMLGIMYPEQMTVELADMVIGGSAHLLSFMRHMGYTLPAARTFVQPNVILFDKLNVEDKRPEYSIGDTVKTDELVFFGRLEQRKGLEIFCVALDYLAAKGVHPGKVSFLGKEGTRVPSCPHLTPKQYIASHAEHWPFEVEIHDNFNQHAAISYMLERPCIAVMPSLIENSTMAAYEALVYRIPFIATRVGGTPELVKAEYHDHVLCGANPRDLAGALIRTLSEGQVIAAPSFSNDHNIETWKAFHKFLADSIGNHSVEHAIREISIAGSTPDIDESPAKPVPPRLLSVCIAHNGDNSSLLRTLSDLRGTNFEVCLSTPDKDPEKTDELARMLATHGPGDSRIIAASEQTLGETFNRLADCAQGDCLVFLRSDIHVLLESFVTVLMSAFSHSRAAAFAPMHERQDATNNTCHHLPMGGDLALGFLDHKALCGDIIAVRKETFTAVGGFSNLHGVSGLPQNLATRIIDAGWRLEAVPELLYREDPAASQWLLDESSAQYMMAMPLLNNAPLPQKKILLAAKLRQGNGKGAGHARNTTTKTKTKTVRTTARAINLSRNPAWINKTGTLDHIDNRRPRMRIGVDHEIPVFGTFVICREIADAVPELVVQSRGTVHAKVPMIKHHGGYFANWILHPVLFGNERAALIKVRVTHAGETIAGLERSFRLEHNDKDTITLTGRKLVEYWPAGRVPAEPPGRYHWVISSPYHPSPQKPWPRLRIGFDETNPVIGIYVNHPEACCPGTTLLIECNGSVLESLVLFPHRRGGAAKWVPNTAAIGNLHPVHLTVRVARNGKTVANLVRNLSLNPGETGTISLTSPAGIESWPNADIPGWRTTMNGALGTRKTVHNSELDYLE